MWRPPRSQCCGHPPCDVAVPHRRTDKCLAAAETSALPLGTRVCWHKYQQWLTIQRRSAGRSLLRADELHRSSTTPREFQRERVLGACQIARAFLERRWRGTILPYLRAIAVRAKEIQRHRERSILFVRHRAEIPVRALAPRDHDVLSDLPGNEARLVPGCGNLFDQIESLSVVVGVRTVGHHLQRTLVHDAQRKRLTPRRLPRR